MIDRLKPGLLLQPFRVLDLTDEKGFLCGKILGDMGADVIKIESPSGDSARNTGPFYHDIPDPEKSLYWFAFNINKRGITLNIETNDGRDIFKQLVRKADFVIESFTPGYMDSLSLGYTDLREINPRIVMVSITPFGQTGPYRDYRASDLVANAASGYLLVVGDSDRAPVRISFDQTYSMAGLVAAVAALVAHYHREATGEGQHVDVSLQASLVCALQDWPGSFYFTKANPQRKGSFRTLTSNYNITHRAVWPCKDGFVSFLIYGGALGAATQRRLVEWLDSEGMAPDFLKAKDWSTFDMAKVSQEELNQFSEVFGKFFLAHTKGELFQRAVERGIMLYPVAPIEDILADPQLVSRDFWEEVEHPELDARIIYPGAFVKVSEAPCRIWRRPPLIGEHNEEIYINELGLSREDLILLKEAGVI